MSSRMTLYYKLLVAVLSLVLGIQCATLDVNVIENCGKTIHIADPSQTPNGYIDVIDKGNQQLACNVTISCDEEYVLSIRLFEVDFPVCSQSDFKVISVLEPSGTPIYYTTFETTHHFCGVNSYLNSDVDLEQYGERKWLLSLKSKPENVLCRAHLAFAVHKENEEPTWPIRKSDLTTESPDTESTSTQKPTSQSTTLKPTASSSTTDKPATASTASTTTTSMKITRRPSSTSTLTSESSATLTTATTTDAPTTTLPSTVTSSTSAPTTTEPTTSASPSTSVPPKTTEPSTESSTTVTATPSAPTTTEPTTSTSRTSPMTRSTPTTTTVAPLPVYRCTCPVTMSRGGSRLRDAPVLDLSDSSDYMFKPKNITATDYNIKCDDKSIRDQCHSHCKSKTAHLSNFGPRRPVIHPDIANSHLTTVYLGDYMCSKTSQNFYTVDLSVHSLVESCPSLEVSSNTANVIDHTFTCYNRHFCSDQFPRWGGSEPTLCPSTFPVETYPSISGQSNTVNVMSTRKPLLSGDGSKQCTCILGVGYLDKRLDKIIEIPNTLRSSSLRTDCDKAVPECKQHCMTEAYNTRMSWYKGSLSVYEGGKYQFLKHVPCEKFSFKPITYSRLALYSHVAACAGAYNSDLKEVLRIMDNYCCDRLGEASTCYSDDIM